VRPLDQVFRSLAARLVGDPQLEVLWTVVVAYAVDVVDALVRQERAAKHPLHDVAMLADGPAVDVEPAVPVGLGPPLRLAGHLALVVALQGAVPLEVATVRAALPAMARRDVLTRLVLALTVHPFTI
jgi:hypothetical protein